MFDIATGARNKEAAEKIARDFKTQKELELAGIAPPKVQYDTALKPLLELLHDWLENGLAPHITKNHRRLSRNRNKRLFEECNWRFVRDIKASEFESWRGGKAKGGIKPKTLNAYLSHVSSFLKWLEERQLIAENPLRVVKPLAVIESIDQRAFSLVELGKLIESADPYRACVYTIAAYTGLRRSELRNLSWSAVNLEGEKSTLHLNPALTKNRKGGVLPIHPDAVAALEALKTMPRRGRALKRAHKVFYRGIPKMPRFLADLKEAGIREYDEQGRRLEFHSLRRTLATLLNSAGVAPRTAMALMRHSDMRLTMKTYTDGSLLPLMEGVNQMPSVKSSLISSLFSGKTCPNVSISGKNRSSEHLEVDIAILLGSTGCEVDLMAEGVGFEPTVPCGTAVFKTAAFDHSATPPESLKETAR